MLYVTNPIWKHSIQICHEDFRPRFNVVAVPLSGLSSVPPASFHLQRSSSLHHQNIPPPFHPKSKILPSSFIFIHLHQSSFLWRLDNGDRLICKKLYGNVKHFYSSFNAFYGYCNLYAKIEKLCFPRPLVEISNRIIIISEAKQNNHSMSHVRSFSRLHVSNKIWRHVNGEWKSN